MEPLPRLYKTSGEKVLFWEIGVEPCEDGTADMVTRHGHLTSTKSGEGKPRELRENISKGKNLGRRNATTPYQQACSEAQARWNKQLERKGYGLDPAQSQATRAISPMLAQVYQDLRRKIDWNNAFTQPKLDGFRCLADLVDGQVRLRSRENKPITTLPQVAQVLKKILKAKPGMILDGELYAHGMPFQKIASGVKRQSEISQTLQYHVYDQISEKPFTHRFQEAKNLLYQADLMVVVPVKTVLVDNEDGLMFCQREFIEEGYEGAMLRHGIGGYEAGKRSKSLLKAKTFRDQDFKIIDVKEGRGTHLGMAIFVCVTGAGHLFDVLSPGSHQDKKRFWDQWKEYVGKQVTVRYQEMTLGDEPVPRFPVATRVVE